MLDSRRLATLQAVLETGSFAGAAARLGYTQSAVSQHIAELERATGLRMLERRPVRPTEAGLVALTAAESAAEAVAAAATELRALRDGTVGNLRVGSFASAAATLVAPAIASLATEHPAIDVTLVQVEPADAHAALLDGSLDVAVTFDYDVAPHPVPRPIERAPLDDDPVFAALPAAGAPPDGPVALADLAERPWIAAPLAGLPLTALSANAGGSFRPSLRFEGDDFRAVLALVAAGLGVALLPRLALRDVPETVAIRSLKGDPVTRRIHVDRLRTRTVPPAVRAVVAALAS